MSCGNSSSNSSTATIDYPYLSKTYCDCAQKSIQLNAQMKSLFDSKANEEFEEMVPLVSEAFKNSVDCCQQAKTAHTTGELNVQKLGRLLKEGCPEMPPRLVLELLKKIN